MREVKFLPAADLDFLVAIRWYEEQSEGQGARFEQAVEHTLRRIVANPHLFQVFRYDIRLAITKGYPYIILFREVENVIAILAVMHTSRDPQLWMDRIDDHLRE